MSARDFDVYEETQVQQGSVLPPGSEFEGVLSFRGQARIEGRLVGTVIADGSLRIEAGGRVHGRVEVDELIIGGELEGEICVRTRLELLPGAQVRADVHAPRLCLAEGSVLDGRCTAGPARDSSLDDAAIS
jgi:cytoskeletal protein CcmA (bactofilin family)